MIVLFTIRATERKARDSNPHSPWGNRVSSAARPTVSGYLPSEPILHEWTAGESNPDLLVASQASFRWTSSPSVDREPRSARESNSVRLLTREACRQRTRRPSCSIHRCQVVPEGVEPPFPLCKRGVVAIGPRDGDRSFWPSSTGGSRTHRHQALSLTAMPVRVPCRVSLQFSSQRCGSGSRTTASELMKLGRAPAHPQCPRPRYRAGQVGLMRAVGHLPRLGRAAAPAGIEPASPP